MLAVPAAAQPPAGLPGADLRVTGELPVAPGPVTDPSSWTTLGRAVAPPVALPDGTPAVRLAANASLRSAEIDVPAAAQTLAVRARSAAGAALVVRAEPADGSPPVTLGTLEPDAAATAATVPVGAVAGRRVRLLIDPSSPLGAFVDLAAVGPFAAPLPGWTLTGGSTTSDTRARALVARGDPVRLTAPVIRAPVGVRRVLVAGRGTGTIRLHAGAGTVTATMDGSWRDVSVPVGPGPLRLRIDVDPEGGTLHLRDLGRYVRTVPVTGLSVRRSGRLAVVTGTLGPDGGGLRVRLEGASGGAAGARSGPRGRFVVRGTVRPGARLTLEIRGDRTRLGRTIALRAGQLEMNRG